MLVQNFNRRTNVAMEHNGKGLVAVGDFEKLLLNLPQKLTRSTQLN